ncbi:hypothetical protein Tco_0967053 [Tanacetum coccineum]
MIIFLVAALAMNILMASIRTTGANDSSKSIPSSERYPLQSKQLCFQYITIFNKLHFCRIHLRAITINIDWRGVIRTEWIAIGCYPEE